MLIESAQQPRSTFEAGTGWVLKPEGACKAEVCIPLKDAADLPTEDTVDALALADAIGLPVVKASTCDLWAIGPEAIGQRTLLSAEAPDFTLPQLDGTPFTLSSLRGRKVLLYAWAPY